MSSSPTASPTRLHVNRTRLPLERCASAAPRPTALKCDMLNDSGPSDFNGIPFPLTACPIVTLPTPPVGLENNNPFADLAIGGTAMRRHHSVCDPAFMAASLASEAEDHLQPSTTSAPMFRPLHSLTFQPQHGATHSLDQRVPATPNSTLPGHGANEQDGKILPCHRVKEDGLMRITAATVSFLH